MSNLDILSMCLRNLFKRKLRTILTMLGVVIGTVAIVVTVSLGLAVDARFDQLIDGMGDANMITVQNPSARFGRGVFVSRPGGTDDGPQVELPELDAAAVRTFENIPGVESVLPVVETWDLVFASGPYSFTGNVMGVRPHTLRELGYEIREGRLLQEGNPLEVVFGSQVALNFRNVREPWDDERMQRIWMGEDVEPFINPMTDRLQMSYDWNFIFGFETQEEDFAFDDVNAPRPIRPFTMDVVGVLERRNEWRVDEVIFMDVDFVQRLKHDSQRNQQQQGMGAIGMDEAWGVSHINARMNVQVDTGYDFAYVRATNIDDVSAIAEILNDMGYPSHYATAHLSAWQEMAASQQQMLGAIGAVSLFVAAIGIANTMVMSTYERTREIGVMKVIGAALADIRKLFLMEAAMIGFFGGVMGVALSYLIAYILNNHSQVVFMGGMLDWMLGEGEAVVSLITPWLSGLALFFAALIGLVSGYYPARRATRLSALNAIRTE